MPSKTAKKTNASSSPKRDEKDKENQEVDKETTNTEKDTKSGHKRQRDLNKEQVYFVEQILDKKKFYGVYRYKVKWQGFSEEECTWEPAKNLDSVKDMLAEFNKNFVPKENEEEEEEEEKSVKPKKSHKAKPKGKEKEKEKEADKTKAKKFEKKSKVENPRKKVKTDTTHESALTHSGSKHGHFKLGDQPKVITNAKKENNSVLFTVEWKAREDGEVPANTKFTNTELRKYDKDLLLDFYEARLKFVKPSSLDSARKSTSKKSEKDEPMEEEEADDKKSNVQEEKSNEASGDGENDEKESEGHQNAPEKQVVQPEEKTNEKMQEEPSEKSDVKEAEGLETVEGEKLPTTKEIENEIDNTDQPIYADISFNEAEDLRVMDFDSGLQPETQPNETEKTTNNKPEFRFESPQETES